MCWGRVRVLLMLIRLWVAGGVLLTVVSLAAAVTPGVCEPGGLALAAGAVKKLPCAPVLP